MLTERTRKIAAGCLEVAYHEIKVLSHQSEMRTITNCLL